MQNWLHNLRVQCIILGYLLKRILKAFEMMTANHVQAAEVTYPLREPYILAVNYPWAFTSVPE